MTFCEVRDIGEHFKNSIDHQFIEILRFNIGHREGASDVFIDRQMVNNFCDRYKGYEYHAFLNNAELFLKENEENLIIIYEVQRKPELFPLFRSLVDQRREPARSLILRLGLSRTAKAKF